jgi:hypothetical protein
MFLVSMFIVYFDYMLSILCLCISSYIIHPIKDPRVGGRDHVSVGAYMLFTYEYTLYFRSCGRSWA